ncbi:MAG TPA: hypothetical protein VGW74_07040 [Propionibacteriaceae bacterium]|nr:hypothetical protein [Propionibacteriaceae bacterium]
MTTYDLPSLGNHPYRRAGGSIDIAAYCRWLDDQANAGAPMPRASTDPNPIPEPRRAS